MKKIFLSLVCLFALSSVCFASDFPDKNNPNCVQWIFSEDTGRGFAYYYTPTLTSLSEGKVDTWVRMQPAVVDDDNEITMQHVVVTPDFKKYKLIRALWFDKNNKSSGELNDASDEWVEMPQGTPFEATLLKALNYAKANKPR